MGMIAVVILYESVILFAAKMGYYYYTQAVLFIIEKQIKE